MVWETINANKIVFQPNINRAEHHFLVTARAISFLSIKEIVRKKKRKWMTSSNQ
jgi:hypothetical protein